MGCGGSAKKGQSSGTLTCPITGKQLLGGGDKQEHWKQRVEKEKADPKLKRVHEAESKLLSLMKDVPFEAKDVFVDLNLKFRCHMCTKDNCCGYHPEFHPWPIHTVIVGKEHTDKMPIVLVHGFMMGAACFFKWYPMLAKERTVYAIDIIGMGGSGQPPFSHDRQTPERAEDLLVEPFINWAAAMGLSEFILLGHSLGGFVVSAWASRDDQQRIKCLGLLSPLLGWSDARLEGTKEWASSTWQRRAISSVMESAWSNHITPQAFVRWIPGAEGFFKRNAQRRFGRAKDMTDEECKMLAEYVVATMATPASAEAAAAVCFEPFCKPVAIGGATIKQRLSQLKTPMFSINGDHDWMEAATSEEIPNCIFYTLKDSGHHLYFDNPEQLTEFVFGEVRKGNL
mmetsp:Transcript_37189/g.67845  ORF Transcript_37189/g.67845 Transcript_37189/m.67845 type:complete len:398 (-) Transcript_37189:38-1231(-)